MVVADRAEVGPSWSPDGTHLAYLTSLDGLSFTLFVADADGRNERPLPGVFGDINPSWSPDGRLIAVVNVVGSLAGVTLVDPDGVGAPVRVEIVLPPASIVADRATPVSWQRLAP